MFILAHKIDVNVSQGSKMNAVGLNVNYILYFFFFIFFFNVILLCVQSRREAFCNLQQKKLYLNERNILPACNSTYLFY